MGDCPTGNTGQEALGMHILWSYRFVTQDLEQDCLLANCLIVAG
jgi:hypothetical protein